MSHSPSLFPLKLLVISLGLVLIGGLIFIVMVIAGKAREQMHGSHCPDAVFHLQNQGTLVSLTPQGSLVQLTVKDAQDTSVLTVERCSGKLLHTFTVAP